MKSYYSRYLVITDDDVPLPPDFDFKADHLDKNQDIASFGYGISAVTPTDPNTGESEFCMIVACQDLECTIAPANACTELKYLLKVALPFQSLTRALADKVSGFFKLFQARMCGTIFYSHGAISCWRRELLGQEILYHHDTEFHGMYEGSRTLLSTVPSWTPD